MSQTAASPETIEVDLRNPVVAGVLGWLIPGAGHLYQRRFAKGLLFMICILGTYFFGLTLGGGHVVYASTTKEDFRWHYFCQVGVGVPALPAVAQTMRVRQGKEPFLGGLMAPPRNVLGPDELNSASHIEQDELTQWHLTYHSYFELGTLYTMVAGLLNILAVYDAVGGPVLIVADEEDPKRKKEPPEPPAPSPVT